MKAVKWLLIGIGVIIAKFALYLLLIGIVPGITVAPQPLRRGKPATPGPDAEPPASRTDVQFLVDGVALSAWLYLPAARTAPAPCIVMAHGLGGTRAMGLDFYARRFQAAGYAVLVFDYRYFGASAGEPRQLIWIPDQLADYAGAIAYARSRPEIDRRAHCPLGHLVERRARHRYRGQGQPHRVRRRPVSGSGWDRGCRGGISSRRPPQPDPGHARPA